MGEAEQPEQPEMIHTGGRKAPAPPSPEVIAPSFPHLEILELIGSGGTGAVYKARQRTLDRFVALKILSPELAQDAAFVARFNREARALATLSHPNIVAVYDAGHAGPHLYLLMEYVDGTNLRGCIRGRRLEARETLPIVVKVCSALQVAHDSGVVHRDIKPENILLDSRGNVKIADFGMVKVFGKMAHASVVTRSTQVMGTPQYMAPEQYETPGDVDHRADLFALGVVLYELLTGELPLGRFEVPSVRADVDVRLDKIVLRALEKDRARRYQQADEIKTDVAALGGSSPVTATAQASMRMEVRPPALSALQAHHDRPGTLPILGSAEIGQGRDVLLLEVGNDLSGVVRALQEVSGCPRVVAKHIASKLPAVIAVKVDPGHAQWIRSRLEAFGAEAEIRYAERPA